MINEKLEEEYHCPLYKSIEGKKVCPYFNGYDDCGWTQEQEDKLKIKAPCDKLGDFFVKNKY